MCLFIRRMCAFYRGCPGEFGCFFFLSEGWVSFNMPFSLGYLFLAAQKILLSADCMLCDVVYLHEE